MFIKKSCLFFVCLSSLACSGIDSGSLERDARLPDYQAQAKRLRQVKLPASLAVYLFDARGDFSWSAKDKGEIIRWGSQLKREGKIRHTLIIPGLEATGSNLEETRAAARKYGANLVLAIKASGESDSGNNPFALLYLTLIGYYVFPGSSETALVRASAAIIDVKNGVVISEFNAKGEGYTWGPGGWLNPAVAMDEAKQELLAGLKDQFVRAVRTLN